MKSQGIQMLSVYITEIMIKQRTHNPCLSRQRWGRVFGLQRKREAPIPLRGREYLLGCHPSRSRESNPH